MAQRTAPGSIVVGVDGSAGSDTALDWAADQASRDHRPLTLVHSEDPVAFAGTGDYPGAGTDYARLVADVRHQDALMMDAAVARVQARHGTVGITQVTSAADPRDVLLELAHRAATVVLGSRGRGPVASLVLGSVSLAVATRASCPVVVLRPGIRPGGGVLVGVDGTEHSLPAVEFAFRTASSRGCPVTVVHCYHDARGPAGRGEADAPDLRDQEVLVAQAVAGMREKFPDVPVDVRLVPGRGAPQLLAASEGLALVVVGHHRRSPLQGVLHDPVARTLLEHARCPVAVVPSP